MENVELIVPSLMLIGFLIGLTCFVIYWIGTDIKHELRHRNFLLKEQNEKLDKQINNEKNRV